MELENMYPWQLLQPLKWERRLDQEDVIPLSWTGELMSNMEEIDLREYDEERELFTMININIPNIKMNSDDRFYINLYDANEDMEDLDKEEEEEEFSIWYKC